MGYFDDPTQLEVENGDTSDETDINDFVTAVSLGFLAVEADVTSLEANQNQAIKWARDPVGTLITEIIGGMTVEDYSARAYASEAREWAESEDGEIDLADGTTLAGTKSAKEHATNSGASASAALSWATLAEYYAVYPEDQDIPGTGGNRSAFHWAQKAEDSADAAAASALIALGQNTVSAGDNVTIDQTGGGPYNFEISSSIRGRNLLINSDFSVNQEDYAANGVASVGANLYGHDMWRANGPASVIYTKNGSADITINSFSIGIAGTVSLFQKNDELIAASGSSVTISFEVVSMDNPLNLYFDDVNLGSISTVGQKEFTVTADGTGTFYFGHVAGGAGTYNPNFRVRNLKVEYGDSSTPYEKSEETSELLRCYKYYYKKLVAGSSFYLTGITTTTTLAQFTFHAKTRMRSPLSVSGTGTVVLGGSSIAGTISLSSSYDDIVKISFVRTSGTWTANNLVTLSVSSFEIDARY